MEDETGTGAGMAAFTLSSCLLSNSIEKGGDIEQLIESQWFLQDLCVLSLYGFHPFLQCIESIQYLANK